MSAQSVEVVTLVFEDPDRSAFGSRTQFDRVNGDISYYFLTSFDIRTLSVHGANSGSDLTGLLYTPTLEDQACIDASEEYVPQNVTRRADLPETEFKLIALAPWISPTCTLAWLAAARADEDVQAFLFYLPESNSTGTPPLANSPRWGLGDGGEWKSENNFPVYALPGMAGQGLLDESAKWSGSADEVALRGDLPRQYSDNAYVRLAVDIDTVGSGSSLPSLWVFLLIVLAILLGVIGLTSIAMHWIQRRRRSDLRNRVSNGQVDLEALGIKRLTVPQEVLDKMPLYIYGSRAPGQYDSSATAAHNANIHLASSSEKNKVRNSTSPPPFERPGSPSAVRSTTTNTNTLYDPLSQPTCAICLDEFVPATPETATKGTTVRELPCHHLFHPECVDAFLRDNSSLCPLCKKTALPPGFCPRLITNAMVRRERLMRRMRERGTADPEAELPALPPGEEHGPGFRAFRSRVQRGARRWNMAGAANSTAGVERRTGDAPTPSQGQQMQDLPPWSRGMPMPRQPSRVASVARTTSVVRNESAASAGTTGNGPTQVQPDNTPGRREWARERAVAMVGGRAEVQDPDETERRTRSRWRKLAGGMFPALAR